jgi:hypothetical protein
VDEGGGWSGGDGDYWVEWVYVAADDLAASVVADFTENAPAYFSPDFKWNSATLVHSGQHLQRADYPHSYPQS